MNYSHQLYKHLSHHSSYKRQCELFGFVHCIVVTLAFVATVCCEQGQDLEWPSEAAPQRGSAALTSCQGECQCSTILSATSAYGQSLGRYAKVSLHFRHVEW